MSSSDESNRFFWWITAVPEDVPGELVRYYLYWRVFYFLAGLAHLLVLLLFLQTGVTFMAVFNIFSVALFVAAFSILPLGYYRLAYWVAITEPTLHGIAATVCVGTAYGFQLYAFLVVILLFIQPFYPPRTSYLMTALTLMTAGLVTAYSISVPPPYVIPEAWHVFMAVTPVMN